MNKEEQDKLLQLFKDRCLFLGIKPNTKTYFKEQASFFAGVYAACFVNDTTVPPYWTVACMSDRPLIEYKL